MSDEALTATAEELAFSRSLFGYDPLEVRAFVSQMSDRMERLQVQQDSILSGNGLGEEPRIGMVIDSVVGDIAEVLEAARGASRKIRERAEQEAADMLAEAAERARKTVASADADAFALRKSAWDASTDALESMKAEGARLRAAAESDALEIIGNAERKAHRKLVASRRDSENAIQAASAESDRLLGLARAKGREILRAAEDRAESVNDQVAVMEKRHAELRREVEALSAKLEGPAGGSGPSQTSTVRVIPPPEPDEDDLTGAFDTPAIGAGPTAGGDGSVGTARTVGWADGTESVRLVETPTVRARVDVDALELADEVARLRRQSARSVTAGEGGSRYGVEQSEPREVSLGAVATATVHRGVAVKDPGAAGPAARLVHEGTPDDLAQLFLELRKEATIPTGGLGDPSRSALSPLERYDRRLLPVTNRALRAVKRQLIDIEREHLEGLQESTDGWEPELSQLAHPLVHVLTVMEREAFEQGHSAATELTGSPLPSPREEVEGEGSESFISGLLDEVAGAVRDARETGHPIREVAKTLSRVYRLWRTDEAERQLRFLAGRSYHRGLVEGLHRAGVEKYRLEVTGGCTECAAAAPTLFAADEVPFLPADTDCRCMLLPV